MPTRASVLPILVAPSGATHAPVQAIPLSGAIIPTLAPSPVAAAAAPAPAASPLVSGSEQPAEAVSAEGSTTFDGGPAFEPIRDLLHMRRDVQTDARVALREHMGGDVGDGRLHKDVNRVAARLVRAAGLPKEAAQVFIGNSFLPNAFTMITKSESKSVTTYASVAKPFRVANVFLSLGLLRAMGPEAQLAFVIAHELIHNWKEHLKDVIPGSHQMLGHFHEFEADAGALKLIASAGYDPREALDTLYALDKAYEKIKKDYSMFSRRDKGEIALSLERVRDVHPHADLRRGNMLDHLDEALERFAAVPSPERPLWKELSVSAARPSALDRFEARARRAAAGGSVDERLHTLESFVEKEKAKRALGSDEKAIVEEAYRDILAGGPDLEGTRSIELSIARGAVVSGKGLSGGIVTRQLELVQAGSATLEDFLRSSAGLGSAARQAGALRLMGQVKTRPQLDAMFRALTRGAESLGLKPGSLTPGDPGQPVSDRLWRSTGRVLSAELGRAARPEEIIDALKAGLSPSWLRAYRDNLQVNIIESAFERPERRSTLYTPSQLALRLRSLDETRRAAAPGADAARPLAGLAEWNARHYTSGGLSADSGRITHRYERYRRIDGQSAPSDRDLLDLLERFNDWSPPPTMIRIMRRDGRYDHFLRLALDRLEERAISQLRLDAKKGVENYTMDLQRVLRASLSGVSDLGETARVSTLIWERVKRTHDAFKATGTDLKGHADRLHVHFLSSVAETARVAIVRLNLSGRRPDPGALRTLAAVVRDIETTLDIEPGDGVVLEHARRLALELGARRSERSFMKTFGEAIPMASYVHIADLSKPDHWWERRDRKPSIRALSFSDLLSLLLLGADDRIPATTKLAAASLADKLSLAPGEVARIGAVESAEERFSHMAGLTAGRWLVESSVRAAKAAGTLPELVTALLRLNELQPSFLNPDGKGKGVKGRSFWGNAGLVRRSEPLRALARGEHPFRTVNVAWSHELLDALDAAKAWPAAFNDRLDLLDFMNASGEFSDRLDSRITAEAAADKEAFRAWVKHDEKRIARWGITTQDTVNEIPIPQAAPLRVVRNPVMRAKLFELLAEVKFEERAPRRGARAFVKAYWNLYRAYRAARRLFSAEFLRDMRREGSLESKYFIVLEEIDRLTREESRKRRERWDRGEFTRADREQKQFLDSPPFPVFWAKALPYQKDDALEARRLEDKKAALDLVYNLYLAFAETQEPLLALLLKNYPEPTRSRDELLERVMKARRLTPGGLSFLEAHKSYRQPNPVRVVEKQLLDQAITHLGRFKPADRVDLILHMAGIAKLSPARVRQLDRMFLKGDRKKLARDKAALRGVDQLKGYLGLMHPKDRAMLVRGMFFGPDSLHNDPGEVKRLHEAIVIDGRDMPPFVAEILRAHFRALTDDEKAVLISGLAGTSEADSSVNGPQMARVALKSMGVTGAKMAQVLATHRGLVPDEYAKVFEEFKDKAQDMGKMLAFDVMKERLDKLAGELGEPREVSLDELSRMADKALADENPGVRRRLARQVRYILSGEGGGVRRIEYVGPELGSGSIKIVYKVELADGRVWVVKLRAPGALYRTKREFVIVETMITDLEKSGTLDLPGVRQLVDEVRALVRAEMDFRDEAAKERGVRERALARPWYARLLVGSSPYVPSPHPVYESEDLLVEEFVPTTRFADLPKFSLLGPSKRSIARRTVDEGTYALLHDEWLEPDAHTGNRYARKGLLDRFVSRLVMIDLGQGQPSPILRLKPLMRAGQALEADDLGVAADALMPTLEPGKKGAAVVRDAIIAGLGKRPEAGIVERLMDAFLEGEKAGALVKPEYAALQKAFLIYAGYSEYLPVNGLYASLERAGAARMLKDGKLSPFGMVKLGLKRFLLGRKAVRAEMAALIESL